MKAVISVIGKDTVGIIARVSEVLSRHSINILDITQSVLSDLFAMIMLVDLKERFTLRGSKSIVFSKTAI